MNERLECIEFLKTPGRDLPQAMKSREISEIRQMLIRTAESIVSGTKEMETMLERISNKYSIIPQNGSTKHSDETFRKTTPGQWKQVLDNQSPNRRVPSRPRGK